MKQTKIYDSVYIDYEQYHSRINEINQKFINEKKTDRGPTILDGLPAVVYSQARSHDCWTWGLWLARIFAPQPVQPSLDALEREIPQLSPCRCQASCGRSINIEQRQTGLPPASHSHNPTPEVAPVTERCHAFQSMMNYLNTLSIVKLFEMVQ